MFIDRTKVRPGLLQRSPYQRFSAEVLVPNKALAFSLIPKRFPKSVVQVNLDEWGGKPLKVHPLVRIGVQTGQEGPACYFDCKTCIAGLLPGLNLTTDEIVSQVWFVLLTGHLDVASLEGLTITTMGTGEPMVNVDVIHAFRQLHKLLPGARFMVSTSGPKAMQVFLKAIDLADQGCNLDLQLSINSLHQAIRRDYLGQDIKQWTLEELSARASEWYQGTGRKAHLNFVIGPHFRAWDKGDHKSLRELFPADRCIVKLSLEGIFGNNAWKPADYLADLYDRGCQLDRLGYEHYSFVLPGVEVPGGSCGAAVPGKNGLVAIAKSAS